MKFVLAAALILVPSQIPESATKVNSQLRSSKKHYLNNVGSDGADQTSTATGTPTVGPVEP